MSPVGDFVVAGSDDELSWWHIDDEGVISGALDAVSGDTPITCCDVGATGLLQLAMPTVSWALVATTGDVQSVLCIWTVRSPSLDGVWMESGSQWAQQLVVSSLRPWCRESWCNRDANINRAGRTSMRSSLLAIDSQLFSLKIRLQDFGRWSKTAFCRWILKSSKCRWNKTRFITTRCACSYSHGHKVESARVESEIRRVDARHWKAGNLAVWAWWCDVPPS